MITGNAQLLLHIKQNPVPESVMCDRSAWNGSKAFPPSTKPQP